MLRNVLTGLAGFGLIWCLPAVPAAAQSVQSAQSAQSGWYLVPSVGVTAVYDDNLFFSIDDAQADTAARVSPVLELGYGSQASALDFRYSFDAESYDKYTDLDSSMVRRFADLTTSHRLSRRLTLGAEAHYTKTNTPLDLSLLDGGALPGLLVGRTDAERVALKPSMDFQISPTASGRLAYTYTHDTLSEALESTTNMLEAEFQNALSPATSAEYGYIYRQYSFDRLATQEVPGQQETDFDDQDSHTPWVGARHDLSSATQISGRAGPRVYQDAVRPYVLLSLRHTYQMGDLQLNYERNETTLLGELGKHESEIVSAEFSYTLGAKFDLSVTPAYGRLSQDDYAVDLYRAALVARYRITPYFHITAAYDMYYQQVDFISGLTEDVSRNVTAIGFYLTYPRRDAEAVR